MLRHRGKRRTDYHNLQLAFVLSFVAGIVNVASVLALKVFTTNITGHFAYFAEELIDFRIELAITFLVYVTCFLIGAFTSNFFAEFFSRRNPSLAYTLPLIMEIMAISCAVFFLNPDFSYYVELTAMALLYSMGVQNAMVTKISKSVVRTTHLTGIFTDLGIEISQLLFYKESKIRQKLFRSIQLKATIVASFFVGGIVGGIGFKYWQIYILCLPIAVLTLTTAHDYLRYQYYYIKRRLRYKH
ncbi:MAG TPA: YoaK family protein [Sphingobacterium sp.]|nr:YoaK family protein [Sphingobacterium sp.]